MNTTAKYPGKPLTFKFEEEFDVDYHVKWFDENWTFAVYAAIFYLIAVYAGLKVMKNRKPYSLQLPLILWSFSLAIFSILSAIRIVPSSIHLIRTKGFIGSALDESFSKDSKIMCWMWLFTLSKIPEFIDTFFIIARKQKLIFLHWYHHALTAPISALGFPELSNASINFAAMNVTIHSMMYTYYTLKAMKFKIPAFISMFITASQITQMILGTIWMLSLAVMRINGQDINMSDRALISVTTAYVSYFFLFVKFFLDAYTFKPSSKNQFDISNNNRTKSD